MKSTLNNFFSRNAALFSQRFPELFSMLRETQSVFRQENENTNVEASVFLSSLGLSPSLRFFTTKSGCISAEENGLMLHSRYDPLREAERTAVSVDLSEKSAAVFLGFGLGYEAVSTAHHHPGKTLILIEPDPLRLAASFACADWTPVFRLRELVFLIGASYPSVITILEKANISSCHFFNVPQWKQHSAEYFDGLSELIERNRQKKLINDRTLESFSALWLRNSCMNIRQLAERESIQQFKNSAHTLRACVIAAGPSLDSIMHLLPVIRQKMVLICVDTALRACLRHGIQPDFIVLADPQYWNARHLDRLEAPDSILLTETAAYPSVFSFQCRKICLFSSMYPIGAYFEKFTGDLGHLGAGGSVSSTAWDFARFIGAKEIFTAGLDLGFPRKRTHAHGSTFEEKVHIQSHRTNPSSSSAVHALFGASPFFAEDYRGEKILTDKRMSLYAWWFESKCAQYPEIRTYSLTHQSMKIKGITPFDLSQLPALSNDGETYRSSIAQIESSAAQIESSAAQIESSAAQITSPKTHHKAAAEAAQSLAREMELLLQYACEGKSVCEKAVQTNTMTSADIQTLEQLDELIMTSACAGAASLVFPTENQLKKKYGSQWTSSEPMQHIRRSHIVYTELTLSAERVLACLAKGKSSFFS